MERIDDLQRNGLKLVQNPKLFSFSTDAVLLADFAKVSKGDRAIDLGTATGILPLLLYGRQPDAQYFGIEIQQELYALAEKNIAINGLCGSMEFIRGDIRDAHKHFGCANDVVVVNPPYEKAEDGKTREAASHQIARKEILIDLNGILRAASRLLRSGGSFYMIHKASRLAEILVKMKDVQLEPKLLRFVQPYWESEPRYVLVQGRKDGREHLRIMPVLILHNADGSETEELKRIYNRDE